ncbi:hypothetical protein SAMD00023353_2500360 [Rosellinia necatrix]|uniref:Uncharacterized protein n=1 Tax=Rosellinia necatrix TaxID=77044 RepID=A0A1S8A858_ROSNE|nr:hypothetical protein SAMD00023353_2500360 [Rosellinia necatrix]
MTLALQIQAQRQQTTGKVINAQSTLRIDLETMHVIVQLQVLRPPQTKGGDAREGYVVYHKSFEHDSCDVLDNMNNMNNMTLSNAANRDRDRE